MPDLMQVLRDEKVVGCPVVDVRRDVVMIGLREPRSCTVLS